MNRLDSVYRKSDRHFSPNEDFEPEEKYFEPDFFDNMIPAEPIVVEKKVLFGPNALKYFYKALQIILVIWLITLAVVTVRPWADYWFTTKASKPTALRTEVIGIIPTKTSETAIFNVNTPKLRISAPIVDGIDDTSLKKGIGHHPDSVWPNQRGNMVIAGHSFSLDANNPYREVFANLRDLAIGDSVAITYQGKVYTYQITVRQTVDPSDMSLFGKSDKWLLTFYTCDPPKTDFHRLVFQAELTNIT